MSITRALKWLLLAPLALLLLICLALGFLLGTATGSGWVLGLVAGQLEQRFAGASLVRGEPRALVNGLSLQSARLPASDAQTVAVELEGLDLLLSFRCAEQVLLCIDKLQVEKLDITPGNAGQDTAQEAPADPLALPELRLPFGAMIGSLRINAFSIKGPSPDPRLQGIALQGTRILWQQDTIAIESLDINQAHWQYGVQGRLQASGDYPLQLQHRLQIETSALQQLAAPLQASLETANTLRELHIDAQLERPQALSLRGKLQPLQNALPFQLLVEAEIIEPDKWLRDAQLANLHKLRLDLSGNREALDANLAALFESLARKEQRLPLAVDARISNFTDIDLRALELGVPGNRLLAKGAVQFAAGIDTALEIRLEKFEPRALFETDIESLNGSSLLQLHYPETGFLQIEASLDAMQVRAGKQSYLASGRIQTDAQQSIRLQDLKIRAGANSAILNGQLPPVSRELLANREAQFDWLDRAMLDANLQLSDLAVLPFNALGAIGGKILLKPGQPVRLDLQARQLSSDYGVAASLDIKGELYPRLAANSRSSLDVAGQGIARGGLQFDTVSLSLGGNLASHRLALAASGARQDINVEAEGNFANAQQLATMDFQTAQWRGLLRPDLLLRNLQAAATNNGRNGASKKQDTPNADSARIAINSKAPIELQLDSGKNVLSVGSFCLSINRGELCSDGNIDGQRDRLDFRLAAFDLASLDTVLPSGLSWRGVLSGNGKLHFVAGGAPELELSISGEAGSLLAGSGSARLELDYDSIRLQSTTGARGMQTTLAMLRNQSNLLDIRLSLAGKAFDELGGRLRVSSLPLALFTPLVPALENMQGELQADLQLGGSPAEPQLAGTLELLDGRFKVANNALELEDIQLQGRFAGEAMQLDGRFSAGEGKGTIEGDINFGAPVSGNIALRGNALRIVSEPQIDMLANLDLTASLQQNRLSVQGEVSLPEGDIVLNELPASAQKLSRDVTFVEQDTGRKKRTQQALEISTDVTLSIGPKLSFKGFDASAVLGGKLRLKQKAGAEPAGSGEIRILEGKYRGFGQRLDVRRGSLLFNGALSEPNIDLEAVRRAEDALVGIRASGPAAQPKIEPFSEPAMPEDQVIYRIITGRAPGTGSETNQSAIIAQTLISQGIKLGGSSLGDTAEKLGIQNFSIGTGDGSDFQVSGYLDPTLYLEYGVNALGDGSTFKLRWDFARRLSLEFIGGLANSLDLFYSREF